MPDPISLLPSYFFFFFFLSRGHSGYFAEVQYHRRIERPEGRAYVPSSCRDERDTRDARPRLSRAGRARRGAR